VIVTYEATRPDGNRFRNTEVLVVNGERITGVEVYFGWNLRALSTDRLSCIFTVRQG
jgi:hypothetical protein